MRPRATNRGFTLIEVLVASTILVLVCSLTWGSFHETYKAKALIEANAVRYHSVRVALERLSREISMSYISFNEDPNKLERRTFFIGKRKGEIDELRFSMMGHQRLYANANEADTSQVAYYGAPDPEGGGKINLMRRETRRLNYSKIEASSGRADVVCDNVVRLQFDFYDWRDKQWRDEWSTMAADGQSMRMPFKVKITLTVRDERGQEVPFQTEVRTVLFEALNLDPTSGAYD